MFKKIALKFYKNRFRRYGQLIDVYVDRMCKCREDGRHDEWHKLADRCNTLLKKRMWLLTHMHPEVFKKDV